MTATVPSESATFCRMTRWVRRLRSTASTSRSRRSSTRIRSLVSLAASLPRPPMATATSAAASEGASLTPSPTMATTLPSADSRRMRSTLSQGRRPEATSGMPISAAARAAAPDLSPVSMRQRMPRAASAASTGLLSVRTSSRRRMWRCVVPSETQTSLPRPSAPAASAGSGEPTKVRLPMRHSRPPTRPRRPSPATLSRSSASAVGAPRVAHQSATERESGCEEAAPRAAAAASAAASPEAGSQR